MPTADVPLRLRDILINIDRIHRYIGHLTLAQFIIDQRTSDAVERCLERITEAIMKVGADRMADIAPSLPFHEIRAFGILLRHHYDKIDVTSIYDTAKTRLPSLRNDCMIAIETWDDANSTDQTNDHSVTKGATDELDD